MADKTFIYDRFDSVEDCHDCGGMMRPNAEGEYVRAFDAINRDKVLTDKVRTLEVQLKERTLQYHQAMGHLRNKNKALCELRDIIQATFDAK